MVVASSAAPAVGDLLRGWRRRRGLSQLEVSLDAAVSARHLSFVETGRARPSRELVLHLAEHFDVPLRERNALLLAAGYAPAYGETPLDAEADGARAGRARQGARRPRAVPGGDRGPALGPGVGERAGARRCSPTASRRSCSPRRRTRSAACLHPDGLAPRIANLAEYGAHLIARLERQLAAAPDAGAAELLDELRGYVPGRGRRSSRPSC